MPDKFRAHMPLASICPVFVFTRAGLPNIEMRRKLRDPGGKEGVEEKTFYPVPLRTLLLGFCFLAGLVL